MQYWKAKSEDGFVSVATINADGEGNSTKAKHDTIVELLRNAPEGYGVVEMESVYGWELVGQFK